MNADMAITSRPLTVPWFNAGLSMEADRSIQTAIQRIFPDKQEETRLVLTRRIMGETVAALSDHDLEVFVTEFQFLIDSWLDEFERSIYNGLTLKQLLMEG